nr:U3 snoRNP protein [Polyrhizophydium stewartii]
MRAGASVAKTKAKAKADETVEAQPYRRTNRDDEAGRRTAAFKARSEKRRESRKRKRGQQAVLDALKVLPPRAEVSDEDAIDSEEEELADMVFGGDDSGAVERALNADHDAVASSRPVDDDGGDDENGANDDGDGEEDGGLEVLGFTIDTSGKPAGKKSAKKAATEDHDEDDGDAAEAPPAWVDDDDEVEVDIQQKKRLRKLRKSFDDVKVSGSEYEQRLREQYERMFPRPKWAAIPEDETADGDDGAAASAAGSDSDADAGVGGRRAHAAGTIAASTRPQTRDLGHGALVRLLRSTQSLVDTNRKQLLSADKLDIQRLKDANQMGYSQAVVQSAQFHPAAPVLLTCGLDKTLRLFQIDGKLNPKIQSLFIKDMPIHRAHFSADGREIIMSGRRKWFYVFDLESGKTTKIWSARGRANEHQDKSYERSLVSPCGRFIVFLCRDGNLALHSGSTKQWLGDIKMNGAVKSAAFSRDGATLWTFGGDGGQVYAFDTASRECVLRFTDEGCVKPTCIAVSSDGTWIATGSSTGVVNLYDAARVRSAVALANGGGDDSDAVKPTKTFMNLTTAITAIEFHPDSQLMVISSHAVKDALRIVHLPSLRVVKNWPTAATPLGYVSTVGFSPRGGHMVVGNAKGKVLLYKLGAYDS